MTAEVFEHWAGAAESIATVLALCVGAYWTYVRFIRQREDFAFIEFTADIQVIGYQDGAWIVELIALLENKGKVQHRFNDLTFELNGLAKQDALVSEGRFGGQAHFPHQLQMQEWIPKASYFLEPGVKGKYSYIARVPESMSFVMLHGRFTYEGRKEWHMAERTIQLPQRNSTAHTQS